jgi:hypothetical protein
LSLYEGYLKYLSIALHGIHSSSSFKISISSLRERIWVHWLRYLVLHSFLFLYDKSLRNIHQLKETQQRCLWNTWVPTWFSPHRFAHLQMITMSYTQKKCKKNNIRKQHSLAIIELCAPWNYPLGTTHTICLATLNMVFSVTSYLEFYIVLCLFTIDVIILPSKIVNVL